MLVGRRSTTVRANVRVESYSRFLATVAAARATTTNQEARTENLEPRVLNPDPTPTTPSNTSAASGRYILRSAPTSVAIGTRLDVGASVMKNQAPRNPSVGRRTSATAVSSRRPRISSRHAAP